MEARIPARLTATEGRRFGLTVGIAFLALAAVALWRSRSVAAMVLSVLGGLLVFAGLIAPTRLGPVERAWMGLAHLISKVTTPIVMGVIYFAVFTPIGVAMRLAGRNPMVHSNATGSTWIRRTSGRSDLSRQF